MEAFMDDESVCTVAKDLAPKTPTAFQLENFAPGKRIRVTVTIGEKEVREARFTCPSRDQDQWKIATVSCNNHALTEKIKLWKRLTRVIGDVDCILHLGDQIYGDVDFGTKESGEDFESAWHASLTLLEPMERGEWDNHQEEVREFYRECYRTTWNMPFTAICLASAANYMICDDHEFTDDLGDEPEHHNPSTLAFYVATLAYQVYNEYQHQLHEDCDVTDLSIKPYYACKLSPRVGFFMTDNRVERSLHRAQGTKSSWENRAFMGPAQWDRVTEAFENDFDSCDVVMFGTPTPLVFLSQTATGVAQKKIDDARGTWGHSDFKIEQQAITKLLSDWQNARRNRAVITLGGDVHMGGFTDSWHNGSDIPLHQLTASAVGNQPEGGMTTPREVALRSAMHADERLFDFKVEHHEWIYGANYGMLDFKLHEQGHGRHRPHVTLTLVGEKGDPKVRNLQFGNSSVGLKNREHSEASEAAHAAAEVMGVPP
ncbi:conserved unknown protein [Ectocarpus siliculosus]|uniref:PhoD-like phosphatase metallophosphatase domain-containing protein n=1 Tax=Ectocarpus siliculosus TaxID=2880 RepID=D7FMC9_ECTSI|nr:conserved unknown protein [Ectocarpus siliculosus]|eukprot:CBJ29947.1 conserved unknown protein [Ectocarpus siliculosus]